jgi:acetyl/propionyl-CoA carboxylase alpha subunit
VIVHGASRSDALYKAFQYLKTYRVEGVPTTIPFHAWILANPQFQTDGIDIGYVERTFSKEGATAAVALLEIDPAHRAAALGSQPYTEVLTEGVFPDGASAMKIVHEEGGTFLAIPLEADGTQRSKEHWRRAQVRAALVGA